VDELRITYEDGRVVPYGLTWPLVPGFPGYRVFMLDLGRGLYERIELRVSGKDIAEETLSRAQIRLLRCGDQVPPALPGQEGTSKSSRLHECLQRAVPSRMDVLLGEVLTAIVTPFDKDGAVDYERFRALARHVIDTGADGLVVAATTGESPTLTDEEKVQLWSAAVDEVGERATIIASTGTYSTAHSVHLTEQAHALSVDGFLVVTPYYNKPPPRGIVEHFKAIAEASDKPIIVYNIPQRVVVNIEPETMAELAKIPTVKAVKQATEDLDQAQRIVDETGLDLYAGSDHLVYPFLDVGGAGGVVVHGNLVPGRVKEMIGFYKEGDVESARGIDEELAPLVEALGVTINPIPVKAALNLLGHEVGGLRLPLVEATEEELGIVRSALEGVGLTAPVRA
jgi:4-hydroxy-tetrahydrodipicolinate synthase